MIMSATHFRSIIICAALMIAAVMTAAGAPLTLNACNSTDPLFSISATDAVSLNTADKQEGDGSFQVTLSQTPTNGPYARFDATAAWSSYSAIRFWIKRTSGTEQGVALQLLWTRHYASVPLSDTWTEVTIRWQNFTQRLYSGDCESLLSGIDTVEFTMAPGETHDGGTRGPVTFLVDNIRLIDGLTPLPTTYPSTPGLPISTARIQAGQPLKIVCLGTSITYGHVNGGGRLTTPWPAAMEAQLESALGVSNITVMNYGVRGAKSWQGAAALDDFVYREQPHMVIIEYLANDYWDAEDGSGVAEYRDNMERLFDQLLRWGQADVVALLPNPYGEAGNTHLYDTYIAQLQAAADARNLFVIDWYNYLIGLPEATLLSYYQVSDTGHFTQAGSDIAAQIVTDGLAAELDTAAALALSIPVNAVENAGVLTNQGTVTIPAAAGSDVIVSLSSNDLSEVTVPATVTITTGNTSASFSLTVVDDALIDGDITVTITASAAGYDDAADTIVIRDDESLMLTIPAGALENAGVLAGQGSVAIIAALGTNLTVSLTSSDTSVITVPASVTITAGNTSATFDLTVLDDDIDEANAAVTITAAAAGYGNGVDTITITDDDGGGVSPGKDKGGCLPGGGSVALPLLLLALVSMKRRNSQPFY